MYKILCHCVDACSLTKGCLRLEEHSRKSSRREKRGQASGGDDSKIRTLQGMEYKPHTHIH